MQSRWMIAIVLATIALGCSSQYDVVPLKGTLTYDGQPVPNVIVQFRPSEGRASQGTTQADGAFEMQYAMDTMGVERDSHEVTVSWSPPDEDGGEPPELVQKVLDDFKANGPIQVTIDSAQSDFEIKLPR